MLSIEELQPYFSAIAAVLGLGTLAFLIRLSVFVHKAERTRAEIAEDRLLRSQEDLERTEKWSEREKQELTSENRKLRGQLKEALANSGMTLEALAAGRSLHEHDAIKPMVNDLISKMEGAENSPGSINDPVWHLELAKGYMAQRAWAKAAEHFDQYVTWEPLDSETQFSRGVAHANRRDGVSSNLSSLRAYNEAIALAPSTLDNNMRARYFAYRGAMLKRMGRVSEAKSDLVFASSLADRQYEINDIKYNLACVYAMERDRENLFNVLRDLQGCDSELRGIRHHLTDYFSNYSDDPEFLEVIGQH